MASASSSRLPWIDNLRTLVILLVVNMHACVTYSHVGDWYALSENEPTLPQKIPFIVWQGHLQSFFMGVLFFVSAYFANRSLERRGPREFLGERLVRLGIPALFYMLVIHPFILLRLNPWHAKFPPVGEFYLREFHRAKFLSDSGPLWFAVALLIFCFVFAGWQMLRPRPNLAIAVGSSASPAPTGSKILLFALGLSVATFAVRLDQPIGTNVMNLQLCFFPQYIAAFIAGISASRNGWLLPLAASPQAARAGWIALIGGPCVLLALLFFGGSGGIDSFRGGWTWQAAALAGWEQFTGVGLALGAMALLSRKFNQERVFLRWLSDRCFAVYVFHAPVLVAGMIMLRTFPQNPYILSVVLTVGGLIFTFALADIIRRVPGLRSVF
jgi:fucose 4-O-acetylase-like acetyltransferase